MKSMEPKKAKTAIVITIIAALLIVAVCLCILFDVPIFGKKEASESPAPVVTESPASVPAKPTPEPVAPSEADLDGTADGLYHPKAESYFSSYRPMITRTENSNKSGKVALQLEPKPWQYYREIVMELDGNTRVTGIAQENGYTLVLYKDGIAGWILTQDLDDYIE